MEQNTPAYGEIFLPVQLADVFDTAAFSSALPIQAVSTGLWDVLLPVSSAAQLSALEPNFEKLADFNRNTQTVGVHTFAFRDNVDAVCRDFAPLYGIPEESATGTASCALACYLFRYREQKPQYVFEQGYELGAPSQITVELQYRDDQINGVFVGGYGRLNEKRSLAAVPSAAVNRITDMERCFDALLHAAAAPQALAETDVLRAMLRQLTDYYENGLWLEDYQRDERGELPQDLKRGVLSQDGVYNLLALLQPYDKDM